MTKNDIAKQARNKAIDDCADKAQEWSEDFAKAGT